MIGDANISYVEKNSRIEMEKGLLVAKKDVFGVWNGYGISFWQIKQKHKMKKLIILTLGLIIGVMVIPAHAQKGKINFGVNAATSFPLGDNSDVNKAAWGVDGSLDYYFNEHVDLGVEAGYRAFPYKAESLSDEQMNMVPLLLTLGLHNDLGDILDLYGELGGGAYMMSNSVNSNKSTYGGLSPRVGMAIELSDNWFLDTAVDYTHVFTDGDDFNSVGLKFGVLCTIN